MASSYQLEKIYSSEIRSGRSAVSVTVSRFTWADEEAPRPFDARVTIEHTTAIGSANALIRLTREQLREAAEVLTAAADAWDARHARPVLAATPCACGARRYEGAEKCAACVAFDRQYPGEAGRQARAATPPTLTADEGAHGWTVVDSDGGRWFPGREAIDAIDGAPDPGARAVAICDQTPMAGEWSA